MRSFYKDCRAELDEKMLLMTLFVIVAFVGLALVAGSVSDAFVSAHALMF